MRTLDTQPNPIDLEFADNKLTLDLQHGAAITYLAIAKNGGLKELLKPHENIKGENPWLFPWPNRLKDGVFSFEGKDYHFPHNDYGRPNSLHGFVHERAFGLSDQGQGSDKAWVELSYQDRGGLTAYPFPFLLKFRYTLSADGLTIDISIVNKGAGNMPVGMGWHPYFDLPAGINNAQMQLPPCQEIEVNELLLPTGKKWPTTCFDAYRNLEGVQLDTCFELSRKGEKNAVLLKASDDYEIEIWQDENHPFLQVYTPDDGRTIAIEPMTCGIDALNTGEGLKVLTPGETWKVSCGVRLA